MYRFCNRNRQTEFSYYWFFERLLLRYGYRKGSYPREWVSPNGLASFGIDEVIRELTHHLNTTEFTDPKYEGWYAEIYFRML